MRRWTIPLVLAALAATPAAAGDLRVAAAADLQPVVRELSALFERLYPGVRVVTTYGPAESLAAQVRDSVAYDVFIAADSASVAALDADGFAEPGSRRTWARGQLALWARKPHAKLLPRAGLVLLQVNEVGRIAVPNPRWSPYGAAAEAAIRRSGKWNDVRAKLVAAETSPQAMELASATTQAALLARGDAEQRALLRAGRTWVLPDSLAPPLPHAMCAIAGRDSIARAFGGFLHVGAAREVIRRHGLAPVGGR
jgi:molybdate transport system substrate-binding protein